MKILFSIGHPAQLNFYRNAIRLLSLEHEILLVYLKRGKLPSIVYKELGGLPNIKAVAVGNHRGTTFSILFEANLLRIFKLVWMTYRFKPDIELSNGYIAGIGPKIFGIPSCHFQDDPEIGETRMRLMRFFCDKIYIPFFPDDKKIRKLNALKEWAYLSPIYFTPDPTMPSMLGLKVKEYVFVREVITSTTNYRGQENRIVESLAHDFPQRINVVLSLEDKSREKFFPKEWIILEEPLKDVHSLIYYAKAVISSGDSIAREGAQLGVPSIYCGFRSMHANNILINEGILFHKRKSDVMLTLMDILQDRIVFNQESFRSSLNNKWVDITELILSEIKQVGLKT
jgi:uncharacterized protein